MIGNSEAGTTTRPGNKYLSDAVHAEQRSMSSLAGNDLRARSNCRYGTRTGSCNVLEHLGPRHSPQPNGSVVWRHGFTHDPMPFSKEFPERQSENEEGW